MIKVLRQYSIKSERERGGGEGEEGEEGRRNGGREEGGRAGREGGSRG